SGSLAGVGMAAVLGQLGPRPHHIRLDASDAPAGFVRAAPAARTGAGLEPGPPGLWTGSRSAPPRPGGVRRRAGLGPRRSGLCPHTLRKSTRRPVGPTLPRHVRAGANTLVASADEFLVTWRPFMWFCLSHASWAGRGRAAA